MASNRLTSTYNVRVNGQRVFPLLDDGGAAGLPADVLDGPGTPVYRPYYPEHFPFIAAGITEPDYMWTMGEASGDLNDLCNGPAAVLTAATNVSYSQTVTGWTRPFVGITAESAGSGFRALSGALWNIGSQSVFALMYSAALASGGNRCFFLAGGGNGVQIEIVAAGQATCFINSVRATGTFVYEAASPTVYPFVLHYDRRGAGDARVYTNKEQIVGTWANLGDNIKGLGSNSLASPTARHGLLAVWVGANAETMFDRGGANLGGKQLITELGWSMAY